jgi:ABC-2 type transport system ATP-binding protein
MLTLSSFEKSFGPNLILAIPSLTFDKGIQWIKGRNGSGKSTLFNCLAGLSPYQGNIILNGIDLRKSPVEYKLKVNFSESEPLFPEFLTGTDLIKFYSKLKKSETSQSSELTSLLGVSEYADQPCGTYSSGMMKKLSILLAFLGHPELIILDEPLITLDKESQQIVSELINKKQKEGVSFLFATHQDFENALIVPTQTYLVSEQTISTTS